MRVLTLAKQITKRRRLGDMLCCVKTLALRSCFTYVLQIVDCINESLQYCFQRIAGRSVNLFFACCKRCEEFDAPKDEILLKLKNVFTAYSVLNVKKIYDVIVGENSKENVMYRERYLVRLNQDGIMERIELPTCLSEGFRLVSSLLIV